MKERQENISKKRKKKIGKIMSKVKYRVREYNPKETNLGTHSWFAEAVISNDIDNNELAKKIAARTGFKAYECQAVVAAIADIVAEEVLGSNRISMADEKGNKMVSIYPRVSGSVSDTDVAAHPERYEGATVATEDMLTPDMLTWSLGASVGVKFSKTFALNKQAQKVKMVSTEVAITDEEGMTSGDDTTGDGNGQPGGGSTPPGGGGTDQN